MIRALGIAATGMNAQALRVDVIAMTTSAVSSSQTVGSRLDVNVSPMGDATSLRGGMLVMTPLQGANNITYAVAQGMITVASFDAKGQGEQLSEGVPTAGRITNGAILERDLPRAPDTATLNLELHNPDPRTAMQIVDAINAYSKGRFGKALAEEQSPRFIRLTRPKAISATRFVSEIGALRTVPDSQARIVVDQRSGTIVMNSAVQILPVAVAHGNLSVRITETPNVSQPEPLSSGTTIVTPNTAIKAKETGGHFVPIGGGNLNTLIQGLNQIGVKPSGIISILQAIKSSGALQADLVVQ